MLKMAVRGFGSDVTMFFLSAFIRILEKNNTPEKREKHLIHIYVGVLRGFNEIRCHHYGEPNVKQCYFSPHFANC